MEIKNIGVIGAGTMGTGIAQVAATAGFDVLLHDVEEELPPTPAQEVGGPP